jgi:hypothetical protein
MNITQSRRRFPIWAGFVVLLLAQVWQLRVDHYVPDPYMVRPMLIVLSILNLIHHEIKSDRVQDEFFHVRQAQVYCSGDFKTWDDKITTPPGLYDHLCYSTTLRKLNPGTDISLHT